MEPIDTTPVACSVAQLTHDIKELLETTIPPLWLRGEMSNFVHHSSGHMYFSLKDEESQIACVMWRARNYALFFTPQDGMEVLAFGSVRVYEKRGNYQFDISRMLPAGVGQLQMIFEKLKRRLLEEGLFDEAHKKSIPQFPSSIGVITSLTGAAVRDIVQIIRRRAPHVRIVFRPAQVQGDSAAQDIAQAIAEINEYGQVDVIIVGRGGGSLEDLWAFNEEIVARAIFASRIPVVSAVGHEIDYTISDFVADLRAPTPSAAAEIVTPDRTELLQWMVGVGNRCRLNIIKILRQQQTRLASLRNSYGLRRPVDSVLQNRQRVDELQHLLQMTFNYQIQNNKARINSLIQRLHDLAPDSILRRGYSLCWRVLDRKLLHHAEEVKPSDQIVVQLTDGRVDGVVQRIHPKAKWTDDLLDTHCDVKK